MALRIHRSFCSKEEFFVSYGHFDDWLCSCELTHPHSRDFPYEPKIYQDKTKTKQKQDRTYTLQNKIYQHLTYLSQDMIYMTFPNTTQRLDKNYFKQEKIYLRLTETSPAFATT